MNVHASGDVFLLLQGWQGGCAESSRSKAGKNLATEMPFADGQLVCSDAESFFTSRLHVLQLLMLNSLTCI